MNYEVKYKRLGMFSKWHKFKRVKGDGLVENNVSRYFILEDESRIEIPTHCIFKFSKERFYMIKERMDQEAGQVIPIKKG